MENDKKPLRDLPDDAEVAELLKSGDTALLWKRLLECKPILRTYTSRFLFKYLFQGSTYDAVNCLDEFFGESQPDIDKNYDRRRSFRAYFIICLRNHCQTVARRVNKEITTTISIDNAVRREGDERTRLDPPDCRPENDSLQLVVAEELKAFVEKCIEKLESKYRDVLLLHIDGDSYCEIGQKLGITAGAARIRIFRARAQLWMCLQQSGYPLPVKLERE